MFSLVCALPCEKPVDQGADSIPSRRKATSRTTDMYVPEKSDCAVVPVNQPNKGGQPSAEAGEGRAQTRENIAQSHMHPTQSGKRMSQGLDGVQYLSPVDPPIYPSVPVAAFP